MSGRAYLLYGTVEPTGTRYSFNQSHPTPARNYVERGFMVRVQHTTCHFLSNFNVT
jgi:hypothetical protein